MTGFQGGVRKEIRSNRILPIRLEQKRCEDYKVCLTRVIHAKDAWSSRKG